MSAATSLPEPPAAEQMVLIAARRFAAGAGMREVVDLLVARGETTTSAARIAVTGRALKRAAFRRGGVRIAIGGLAIGAAGAGVTALSYHLAAPGGTYLVATGAIAVGGFNVVRGLWRMAFG